MSKPTALRAPPANRLLAAMPNDEYRRLLPELEQFPLVFGELIYKPGALVNHVYFPTSGIVSLLADVDDGDVPVVLVLPVQLHRHVEARPLNLP